MSISNIGGNIVSVQSAIEREVLDVKLTLSLDYCFNLPDNTEGRCLDDDFASVVLSIDQELTHTAIKNAISRYIYDEAVGNIELNIEAPDLEPDEVSTKIQKIIDELTSESNKIKGSLNLKDSQDVIINNEKAVGNNIVRSDVSVPIKSMEEIDKEYQDAVYELKKDSIQNLSGNYSTVGDFMETGSKAMRDNGQDIKLGSNNKIYTKAKANGNQYYKIVAKTSNVSKVMGKLGAVGSKVSTTIEVVDAITELDNAKTVQQKGEVLGKGVGRLGGNYVGGLAGGHIGVLAGGAIVGGLAAVGIACAPITFVVVGGCALYGAAKGSELVGGLGEKYVGDLGKNVGKDIEDNPEKYEWVHNIWPNHQSKI